MDLSALFISQTLLLFHRMESTIIHKFTHPGVFLVGVECTTSDWNVAAQKSITIQEPVGDFSVIMCNGQNMSTGGAKCNALFNIPIQIQLAVEAGESVWQPKGHDNTSNKPFLKSRRSFCSYFL